MFHLEDSLGFLVNRAAFAMRRAIEERLARHGLTAPQWAVLCRLWEQEDQSLGALGRSLYFDKPTISGITDRLAAKKLLVRVRDARDRRVIRVRLTEAGRRLESILVPLAREVNALAARSLDAAERRALGSLLARLSSNLGV